MRPSLNRRLLVLPLLITGALVLPGMTVASERYLEAALLPTEPSELSASGTYRAIEVELA